MSNNARVKTILILAANPTNTARLRLDQEIREIDEALRRANKQELLKHKWAVRSRDFYRAMIDYQPHIVHFCGHGAGEDGIVLEGNSGKMELVQTNVLASTFKFFAPRGVECVILNACYSEVQAEAISQYVNYVVGMNRAVGDQAAITFAVAFYDAIAAECTVEEAYELGRSQMMSFRENEIPVLKTKKIPNSASDDIAINFEEVIPPNPYQGLAAFEEEDADFFFGQENFVNNLVEVTHKQPLVAVVGPSGSGKSSVVFAGLIPKLRKEGNWLIEIFRPGNKPFEPLAFALVRQLEPETGKTQQLREAVGLAGDMQQGRITLQQVVSRILECNSGKRLLLVADQFEELYTLCQVKEEQERFANELLTAIAQENITLVLTLRADFYAYVLSYRPLRDALQEYTPQLLSSMKREELQAAIELPAQKLEVQLEPQLTQRILDDVGQEPGNLPLLEFALTRLWEKQINRELTHQAYEEIGGVKKAIANHAEQVYQQLSEIEKKQAQRIFVQLVRPGEGTEDTRRIATRAEVGEENWNLVSYLAGYQARLVVTGRQEPEDTVEVVHEALIREWGTLREWINATRDFRTWQERLKVALREWKNNNHDSGALLRGVPLNVAEDWLQKRADEMTQEEQDFIQVSVQQREREKEEEESRQQEWRRLWQQAEISRSEAISLFSMALFSQGQEFDALMEALRAAQLEVRSPRVEAALRQAVYGVRERRLEGHSHWVSSVAFSPDGLTLATASWDNTIKLWNLQTQTAIATLTGHSHWVTSVAFSPDGLALATASWDNTIKLWNLQTQTAIATLTGHSVWVSSVAFSPDGLILATASGDNTIKLWNLQTQTAIATLTGHSDAVNSVAFSPDGLTLATASGDNTIKLWNLQTQTAIAATLTGHSKRVNSVAFSPDGLTLATASDDNTIKLWNLQTQTVIATLTGHSNWFSSVAFSPDGLTLATASGDNTIKLWNLQTQTAHPTLTGHSDAVNSVAFSPDGLTLATASGDNTIKLWNLQTQTAHPTLTGHSKRVNSVAFSPDGLTLATASDDKTIKLWNLQTQTVIATLTGHSNWFSSVAFSPDGLTLASGNGDNTIKLWNLQTQTAIATLTGHSDAVNSVAFSPDGLTLATASDDKTIKLWNLQTQTVIATLTGHSEAVSSVAFSPDGLTLATASYDNTIKLWNLQTQTAIATLTDHSHWVSSVAFSPDGLTLATASLDKTIKLWNLQTQTAIATLTGHSDMVFSVAFSPDGLTLVSARYDKTIKLWNLQSQKEIATLTGHSGPVNSVAFSPDGKTLASASDDMTIKLWNFDFDDLRKRGCAWVRSYGYLESSPNISDSDRHLCDGIPTNQ